MVDLIQLLVCTCNSADAIAMQGDDLEIPATNLGTVAFLVEGAKGHKCVPNGWRVQSILEAELSLPSYVWDLDGQCSSANCREPLLIGRVEEHWWG